MSAMLSITGTVVNVFNTPDGANRETGEVYQGGPRVQLLAEEALKNGQTRMSLVTLSTDLPSEFEKHSGTLVRVPVGAFVQGAKVGFYALKGHRPEPVGADHG